MLSPSVNVSWIVSFPPIWRLTEPAYRRLSFWHASFTYKHKHLPTTFNVLNLRVTRIRSIPRPNHVQQERERRQLMKKYFTSLQECLPPMKSRPTKQHILHAAIRFIQTEKQKGERLQLQLSNERRRHYVLQRQIIDLNKTVN